MYINFKSKYKKIIWILIGFCLACFFIDKVHAQPVYVGTKQDYNFDNFSFTYNNCTYTKDTLFSSMNTFLSTYSESIEDYNFAFISVPNSPTTNLNYGTARTHIAFFLTIEEPRFQMSPNSNIIIDFNHTGSKGHIAYIRISLSSCQIDNSWHGQDWNTGIVGTTYSGNDLTNLYTNYNFDFSQNLATGSGNIYTNIFYDQQFFSSLPDYLNGYKKIDLTTSDRYYMLSGISSGSVFIPMDSFLSSGGRLSYYDNDIESQPYTSYIQDYVTTPDGLYARQDFNLSNYVGADWVMFSKYIYLEGEDDISYSIYVPTSSYDSDVIVTPNTSGGNDFTFDYLDSNGDVQSGSASTVDLSQNNPLLGTIFSDFSSNTFGLTSIITAPLSLISSLSSTSCSTLTVPLPYISSNLTLPCMSTIYSNTFGSFFTLYQTITTGIISYWIIVKIFNLVKDFKNPDHDEIEVVDL